MRLQELDNDAQHELRRIVATVDKKLQVTLQDGPSPQDPLITLSLSQGAHQGTMAVSVEQARRAVDDARERAILRERIKRTHARIFFPSSPERPFDTSAIRPGAEAFAHFRGGRR